MTRERTPHLELLGTAGGGALYRARPGPDGPPVLEKQCGDGPADAARFRREYARLQSLDVPEIARPRALREEGGRLTMVFEDFAGESLETVLARALCMALPAALSVAAHLARALAALHAAGLVHRDVRPANVLVGGDGPAALLVDVSCAAPRDAAAVPPATGDWAYLSPEQTGRMNRPVDHRTDFYALGITLYRMLTGQLPFQADDPAEWAHCHLARTPPAVADLVPEVPAAVSDLVRKLLVKVPEERYQSATGLLADLEHCRVQWQATAGIVPFVLGTRDVSDRIQIPQKLYGRDREIATLLAAFERTASTGRPALMTVAGYSGVGKSALVHALQQPIAEGRGYFLAGKCDQYQRDIPYAPLAQAFDRLVRQLLGESDAALGHWRDALRETLGPNGGLLVTLVPGLRLIVGDPPPAPELPPQDAQRRFQRVFRQFVGVFARQGHPLVLFLDDLQWLDAATLDLLEDLLTHPEVHHLLLVGAFRDNEVTPAHPLMRRLDTIRQAGAPVQAIMLAPLAEGEVAQLMAEALHCPPGEARPLAQLVVEKTGGNPFFALQFLTALAEERLLAFEHGQARWTWDLEHIRAKGFTDNVVELMVGKLHRLPATTQDALKQLACLGHGAAVDTLSLVHGDTEAALHAALEAAVRAGLVFRLDGTYRFLHDRVQEAAYALIPDGERASAHLAIGRRLAAHTPSEQREEAIFDIVSQLNRGADLITSATERAEAAELNLVAGRRAKASAAYAAALTYLMAGRALLPEDGWEGYGTLTFALEFHQAECEFLTGAWAAAEERLSMLSGRAGGLVDFAAVTRLRVELLTTLGWSDRAIEVCLDYLRHVGVQWSAHPTKEEVRQEYARMWHRLGDRPIEALLDLPRMTDPLVCGTMDVLIAAVVAATFTDESLRGLVIGRMVSLSLEHGNSDASCQAYAKLGTNLGPYFGDYKAGFRFGQLAVDLVERRALDRFKARVYVNFGCYVNPWARHVRTGCSLVRRAFDAALQAGDLSYAVYSRNNLITLLLANGDPLAEVQREAEAGLDFVRHAQFGLVVDIITTQIRLIQTLRGLTPNFGSFEDAGFNEEQFEQHLERDPRLAIAACWYWIRKLQARVLADDLAAAIAAAAQAERLLWTSTSVLEGAEYHFYSALARAALSGAAPVAERTQHLEALAAHHRQLQVWAENCPENFASRAALVGAEIARVEGRDLDAQRLYEQALRAARDNGFAHDEAIAYERASAFYRARGLGEFAELYLRNARDAYRRWGAEGKVRQLEARYPQLRPARAPADGETRLDLLSVAKAAQAISGQLLLDELVDTLLRLVLEAAGAQTGCLLLARGDELALAATADVEQQTVRVRRPDRPGLPDTPLPRTLLNYVRRSREPVLLTEAAAPHPFSADPYFAQQHPQSVLCLPILRQSALAGLLYLENRLTPQAFPPNRVRVLELLASQAAISLENAQLYADVRDSHARIRRLVESNIIGMLFWGANGNVTEANDAFLDMTGYTRDDVACGRVRWTDITPQEYREADARAADELQLVGTFTPFEKEYVRQDGRRVPVLVGGAFFEGSRETGVAFVLDLTERKQAEGDREARRVAEAANRAKSAFLANMSHELRTPLNGILGYAQILLRDRTLAERQAEGLNVIQQSGEHLLTLINDILDLAKIEAGKLDLNLAGLPLAKFLTGIAGIIGVKAWQKSLDFICDLAPDLPSGIRADEGRLRQILLSLLANAVKFTDRGQVTLRVRCVRPGRLRFEVQDTGIGIREDQLDTIFQPFEQVSDTQRRLGGTGLGLAISRQLVRRMGSDIQVESHADQGSRFWFELDVPVIESQLPAALPAAVVTGYEGPRHKILVVDDVAYNRAVIVDLLGPLGFELVEATDGLDALDMAQALQPDLIVMDLAMPVMGGLEATRRLRRQAAFRTLPIVAMSASVSGCDAQNSRAAGMDAFLPKPLDLGQFLTEIGRMLQLHWIYEQPPAPSAEGTSLAPLVVPPPPEMETLHHLAEQGSMRDILQHAERIAGLDESYRPFADQLRRLARSYQSQAIQRFVEQHLDRH